MRKPALRVEEQTWRTMNTKLDELRVDIVWVGEGEGTGLEK